jgi:two-component system chemotaxis response regulator CheY
MPIERFLIVDESDTTALMWTMLLQSLGYKNVDHAKTGHEGLDKAKRGNAQFIITSWENPSLPGTIFIQKARQELKKKYIPFLIYSTRLNNDDIRLLGELSYKNVLPAPIDKAAAAKLITEILEYENKLPAEEVRLRKIESYFAAGKNTDALGFFDGKLRKKGPYFVRAHVLLARIWLSSAQHKKAEECLLMAIAEEPNNFDARALLANALTRLGRSDEALAILMKMSTSSPKNIEALMNLGSAYVEADRHAEAAATFSKIDLLDPDNSSVKDEKAKLAFKEGDIPLAAKLLAETQNGDMLSKHFNNVAIALVHKQNFEKALETYRNAISLLNNKASLHALFYNMGLALSKKGDYAEALSAFLESYRANPAFEKSYVAMAKTAQTMKEAGLRYNAEIVKEANLIRRQYKESLPKGNVGSAS